MDPRVKAIRLERWRDIIVACNTSGMKKKEWFEIHNICAKTFYRKQKELRELEMKKAGIVSADNPAGQNARDFFDVTTALTRQTNAVSMQTAPGCNVSYPQMDQPELMIQVGAYNLYVGGNVKETTLATVLKVIGRA